MVELIPAQIEDTIILNVSKHCGNTRSDCKDCCNWLISTELQYVVIDLQDVKDVCRTFIPNQLIPHVPSQEIQIDLDQGHCV